MEYIQFRNYHIEEQLVLTMKHGILLMEFREYNTMVRLFAFQDFYVEVTSNHDSNEVVTVITHENLHHMDHLLNRIDISSIAE